MSVTNINSKAIAYATGVLQASCTLDITTAIPHIEGGHLVVGEKYEMYAPAASGSAQSLGILWDDTKHYSFTFAGITDLMGELYICTKDINYGGAVVPESVQSAFDSLREELGGVSPLCPTYIALKFIRPLTDN